ncbi:Uncharacterized protein TCAP_00751 [Tolypocladium capitatum]|uniref:Uncharacterized protein n=1 Tax=Tolypocladium capitatum TaxID=45235 RepID=A0A2K3QP67_9HYPO|nr:Uncharacterized protein TCAP_00751 [Tolypocladium capitatum]
MGHSCLSPKRPDTAAIICEKDGHGTAPGAATPIVQSRHPPGAMHVAALLPPEANAETALGLFRLLWRFAVLAPPRNGITVSLVLVEEAEAPLGQGPAPLGPVEDAGHRSGAAVAVSLPGVVLVRCRLLALLENLLQLILLAPAGQDSLDHVISSLLVFFLYCLLGSPFPLLLGLLCSLLGSLTLLLLPLLVLLGLCILLHRSCPRQPRGGRHHGTWGYGPYRWRARQVRGRFGLRQLRHCILLRGRRDRLRGLSFQRSCFRLLAVLVRYVCSLGCQHDFLHSLLLLLLPDLLEGRLLVKQNVCRSHARLVPEEVAYEMLVDRLHHLVVEQEPTSVLGLDDGNVVTVVGVAANVHDDGIQLVQPVRIFRVLGGVEHAKVVRIHNTVEELLQAAVVFSVLESLQVQREHLG